jgi:hypothetical protein
MSQHDDLFQELGRTLEVSPSPYFADGVRARITRRRMVLRATVSGLAIAATLVLAVVLRTPAPVVVEDVARVAPAPVVPAPVAPTAAAVPMPTAGPREPRTVASQARVAVPVAGDPGRVVVVTNQMAVLQAIWAGHRVTAGETEAPPVVHDSEPAPIVIEPVRVMPVVIADSHTPVGGLPIIRRAVAALESK